MDDSWMLPAEAIEYVVSHCLEKTKVLEFGSGHGSQLLANHVDLYSVEHDESWIDITSSSYIFAPIQKNTFSEENGQSGWYDLEVVEKMWPKEIEFVVIDGPPGVIGRFGILSILHRLESVSAILVDDVDRPDEHRLALRLADELDMSLTIHDVDKPRKGGTERKFAVLLRRND